MCVSACARASKKNKLLKSWCQLHYIPKFIAPPTEKLLKGSRRYTTKYIRRATRAGTGTRRVVQQKKTKKKEAKIPSGDLIKLWGNECSFGAGAGASIVCTKRTNERHIWVLIFFSFFCVCYLHTVLFCSVECEGRDADAYVISIVVCARAHRQFCALFLVRQKKCKK